MTNRESKSWSAALWLALLLLVSVGGCDKSPPPPVGGSSTEPVSNVTLKVERDCVGPWKPMNNHFRDVPTPARTRFGFLMQLGRYDEVKMGFTRIVFKKGGEEVASYKYDKVDWVDIVGGGSTPRPMAKARTDGLRPKPKFNSQFKTACDALESCVGKKFCCECDTKQVRPAIPYRCVSKRKLHGDLADVDTVLTYWEGDNGYVMRSKDNGVFTWFDFEFLDPVEVWIDGKKVTKEFDTIVVEDGVRDPGVTDGTNHDPPWPVKNTGNGN